MENKHLGKYVIRLANQIKRQVDHTVAPYGLTGSQARVIGYIYERACTGDIYQKDIEEEFDIRKSSVTSILKLLEKNGFIKRVSVSSDARLKRILLTEKGMEVHSNVISTITTLEESFSSILSDQERTDLMRILSALSQSISQIEHTS